MRILDPIGKVVSYRNRLFEVTNKKPKSGDLVWNEVSETIAWCVCVVGNDIVVRFDTGRTLCFFKKGFQKLVKK